MLFRQQLCWSWCYCSRRRIEFGTESKHLRHCRLEHYMPLCQLWFTEVFTVHRVQQYKLFRRIILNEPCPWTCDERELVKIELVRYWSDLVMPMDPNCCRLFLIVGGCMRKPLYDLEMTNKTQLLILFEALASCFRFLLFAWKEIPMYCT